MIFSHFIFVASKCEEWKRGSIFIVGPGRH